MCAVKVIWLSGGGGFKGRKEMPVKTSSSHHPRALCFPGLVIRRTEIRNNVVLTLLNLHFSVLSAQAGHSGGLKMTRRASNKSEQSDALCRLRGGGLGSPRSAAARLPLLSQPPSCISAAGPSGAEMKGWPLIHALCACGVSPLSPP